MNIPLLTWSTIVGLVTVGIIVHLFRVARSYTKGKHKFFEMGTEREEFYIPGDPLRDEDWQCDYDEEDEY